mmetsp:Transcript_30366/g.35057  ORF Transcript_30366/g.35057 Transcript_30366/m.35057 type:complete len:301 (-) Transcript_30366:173-1075(-)
MDRIKQLFSSEKSSKSLLRRAFSKSNKANSEKTKKCQVSDQQAEELSDRHSSFIDTDRSDSSIFGSKYQQERKTLIFDLDNTLIFTCNDIPESGKFAPITLQRDGEYVIKYVIKRPGLLKFLKSLSKNFNICVFTSAEATYARKVIEAVKISKYIYAMYDRTHCKKVKSSLYQKNIWSLGFEQKQVILIDDFAFQAECQPENCIQIKPFEGDVNDRELYQLYPFLQRINQADDVRPVQKNLNNHLENSNKSKIQKCSIVEECNDYEVDLDEGCSKSFIRTFVCRPSMTKESTAYKGIAVC